MSDADVLTRPIRHPSEEDEGTIHIFSGDDTKVGWQNLTMLCGAQCIDAPDAMLIPEGFDYYYLGSGHEQATCRGCRRKVGLP